MAQWVKDLALSLLQCGSDPWLGNFHLLWVRPKKTQQQPNSGNQWMILASKLRRMSQVCQLSRDCSSWPFSPSWDGTPIALSLAVHAFSLEPSRAPLCLSCLWSSGEQPGGFAGAFSLGLSVFKLPLFSSASS